MRAVLKGAGHCLAPVILIVAGLALSIPAPALAQGLGLSGNFYRQHYEMAPGESLPSEDVYVVVTNSSDAPLVVDMVTATPPGVTLILSEESFTLAPGAQQQVDIGVQVSDQAAPGEYTLAISAEAQREGTGIKVSAGVEQSASLSVLGESGQVTVTSVTEAGEPFPALIDIYQETADGLTEIRAPEPGRIETRLKPGDYIARASYQDIKVAERGFSLANGETKEISLVCYALFLESFSVSPVNSGDGKLASARIEYTLVNLSESLADVRAVLKVALDGQALEENELVSFSTLDPGSRDASASYIPAQGWQDGHTYGFMMELYAGDSLRYQSATEELSLGEVSPPAAVSSAAPASNNNNNNRPLIIGIIAATATVIGVTVGVRRHRTSYLNHQIGDRRRG